MLIVAIALGLAIGFVVGSVGGGGAILALPVFVYVLGEPVGPASTASLIVVSVAAAVGAGLLAARGHVCWRVAAGFAPPAAAGAFGGTAVGGAVSAELLVVLFVPLMLAASAGTWARAQTRAGDEHGDCPRPHIAPLLVAGLAIGVLTGFFGVGGGFVIMPVLTVWFRLGFRRAVASSLVIVTFTGTIALASHLLAGSELDVGLTVAVALPTALGAFLGTRAAGRLPAAALGRAFAIVVGAVALFLLADVLALGGPPGT